MKALIASLLLVASLGMATDTPIPTQTGVYYQSPTGYVRIERTMQSGFKTSGKTAAMFTYGAAKISGLWVYNGASAPTQLTDHKPTFVVVAQGETSLNDIHLLKMIQKKDHREVQYCKAGAWSGVDTTQNKDAVPVTATRAADGSIMVVPTADLPAGEYFLVTGLGNGAYGYDFGVK